MREGRGNSASMPVQHLYRGGTLTGLGDGPLLERFASGAGEGAELAFEALMRRHGPMVLRVCRRLLGDAHEAQDAFQATFLVLARRAGSLRDRGSLGGWLYGVATRVSLDARASASRRREHERRHAERASVEAPAVDPDRADAEAALHEELGRLPERYRTPLVLCYLQGLTHEQAAEALGSPVGTVRSRLARGRDRLRTRLARRGLAPTAAALSAALVGEARAAVPRAVVRACFSSAAREAGWAVAAPSIRAVVLSQGVLRAMFLSKLKLVALTGLAAGGLLITGAGVTARDGGARPAYGPDAHGAAGQVVKSECYNVHNVVPGETEVLWVRPSEGGVNRGQLVCELNPALLRNRLVQQDRAAKSARVTYRDAVLARDVAELALAHYVESYPGKVMALESQIRLAKSNLARAKDRLEWSNRMRGKAYLSKAQNQADSSSYEQAKLALEQLQSQLAVLRDHTRARTIKELKSEVEEALADEHAKDKTWEREEQKAEALRRAIERCRVPAPADGELILAPGIEEGATVREGQLLFRVLVPSPERTE